MNVEEEEVVKPQDLLKIGVIPIKGDVHRDTIRPDSKLDQHDDLFV